MSENRDEILANFQACTGIEDVGLAIIHLEESNWDLMNAVGKVMPSSDDSFNATRNSSPDLMIVEDNNDPGGSSSISVDDEPPERRNTKYPTVPLIPKPDMQFEPSTSKEKPRTDPLKFNITYKDRTASFTFGKSSDINDLKLAVEHKFGFSPCRQVLSGWPNGTPRPYEPFSTFSLDEETNLDLYIDSSTKGFDATMGDDVADHLCGTYNLKIKCNDETFNLNYKGTTQILELKTGIYALTNIEVRNQVWEGWSSYPDDQTMLALSGINFPDHEFTVSTKRSQIYNIPKEKNASHPVIQVDSDEDEYEDASESFNADDDYFCGEITRKKADPLIPDNVEDEMIGSITFTERFTARYGPVHPAFFQGSLEDALQEACNKPAKERKILAIYLHHDSSVLSNVFCAQLLAFESVMETFERSFILWGWDLTFDSNSRKLQQSFTSNLGAAAATSLKTMPLDRLPAIFLIMRVRSTTEIFNVIHGNVGVNELLTGLIEAVELFNGHQKIESKEEEERAERELVKWEQDQAYRESLEADRAKEEAKRSKEEAEEEVKRKQLSEIAEEMRRKEEYRLEVEKGLPNEPPVGEGDKENVTQFRFRLPMGKQLERKFFTSTPLKVVLDFLIVEGYPSEEYKVISSWPRRDLTSLDQSKTLHELQLYPQETVILEER